MVKIGLVLVYAQVLDVKDEIELINTSIEKLKADLSARKPVRELKVRRHISEVDIPNPNITVILSQTVEDEQITEQDLLLKATEAVM